MKILALGSFLLSLINLPLAFGETAPPLPGPVMALAVGARHTCALTQRGGVKCWGSGEYGQLGDGHTLDSAVPVSVSGLTSRVRSIAAGGGHTCALLDTGRVKCWGWNNVGQLGDGGTENKLVPVDVTDLSSVTAISAGLWTTCAALRDGGVKCWGSGSWYQMGDGRRSGGSILSARRIERLNSIVTAVATGDIHTCVLTQMGGVKCWGAGYLGGLDDNIGHYPRDLPGLASGITRITVGYAIYDASSHTCVLTDAGAVKCWGYAGRGKLGNGRLEWVYRVDSFPQTVVGLNSGITSIAAGEDHTCALTDRGGVKCWGRADCLGNGSVQEVDQAVPVDVTGIDRDAITIAAGGSHTCALMRQGRVKCWGIWAIENGWEPVPVEIQGL